MKFQREIGSLLVEADVMFEHSDAGGPSCPPAAAAIHVQLWHAWLAIPGRHDQADAIPVLTAAQREKLAELVEAEVRADASAAVVERIEGDAA